jgi:hypothetical protein
MPIGTHFTRMPIIDGHWAQWRLAFGVFGVNFEPDVGAKMPKKDVWHLAISEKKLAPIHDA